MSDEKKAEVVEFPKWVEPHPSHIVGGVAALFAQSHTDRVSGKVSVLVNNAEDEAVAAAEMKAPEAPKSEEKPAETKAAQ